MTSSRHVPDFPTYDQCKDVALTLDFPGEITESDIERVVMTFLESRDLLPDLLGLKKHIRYVFGKRIGRIQDTARRSVVGFTVYFNRYAEPAKNRDRAWVIIDLPYRPIRMFKRISGS
jgi:hypothetical protein